MASTLLVRQRGAAFVVSPPWEVSLCRESRELLRWHSCSRCNFHLWPGVWRRARLRNVERGQ